MKPRTLEDICNIDPFYFDYKGNIYCSLAYSKQIGCKYHSKEKDQNGLYPCINPLYTLEYNDKLIN